MITFGLSVSLYENCKDTFVSILYQLRAVRRSPEAFQKTGLVALSAIQAINFYFEKNYFSKFVTVLEEVPTYDFFGILKLPYTITHEFPVSLLERGAFIFSALADVLCVPDFLQNWKVIDLSSITKTIGRYSNFSFFTKYPLGNLVWSCLFLSFVFQAIHSARQLTCDALTSEERHEITWKLVAAVAESIFCLSNLLSQNRSLINILCLCAKSTGLVSFFISRSYEE